MVAHSEFLLRECQNAANDLACPVRFRDRFIRLRSPAVSGCASRSARAAASTAAGDISLTVLPEVVVLLILVCYSKGMSISA
jgi:hypothetical protein